jgi:hypothetical protein
MIEPMVEQMAPKVDNDESKQDDNEAIGGEGEVTYIVRVVDERL